VLGRDQAQTVDPRLSRSRGQRRRGNAGAGKRGGCTAERVECFGQVTAQVVRRRPVYPPAWPATWVARPIRAVAARLAARNQLATVPAGTPARSACAGSGACSARSSGMGPPSRFDIHCKDHRSTPVHGPGSPGASERHYGGLVLWTLRQRAPRPQSVLIDKAASGPTVRNTTSTPPSSATSVPRTRTLVRPKISRDWILTKEGGSPRSNDFASGRGCSGGIRGPFARSPADVLAGATAAHQPPGLFALQAARVLNRTR
jgi:hypothetical protein